MRMRPGPRLAFAVLLIAGSFATAAGGQGPAELIASGHVRIRAALEPEAVLVGQRARLRVEVMTKTWFLVAPDFPLTVEIPDAVVPPLESFGTNYTERIGADTYAVQARTYEIFPVAPGRIAIPPIEVTLVVALEDSSRSEPVPLTVAPPVLEASVPEAARGLGLVVATPGLAVEESWSGSLEGLRVGDALTRTVKQTVEGSVPMVLTAPGFTAADGVGVYPERPVFESKTDRGEFSGSRTDTVSYVMEAEGSFELPEVVLAWWDLGTDQLRREILPAALLDVAPNPELAAEHLAAPEDAEEAAAEAEASSEDGIPWRTVLVLGALLLVVLAARRPLGRLLARFAALLERPDDPEATAWQELRRKLEGRDAVAVLAALYAWRDRLEGLPGPPTLESLAALAADPDLGRGFRALQDAATGADADWQPADLARRLAAARKRWRRAPSTRPSQVLGPLNPPISW